MSIDYRCEKRSNLEIFQDFIDHEIRTTQKAPRDRVYNRSAEYFFDALTGTLYKDPEEFREWVIALLEAFREAKMDSIGTLIYTTVYKDIIQSYEDDQMEFLDYED